VIAQRTRTSAAIRAARTAAAFLAAGLFLQYARPDETAARVACYVIANIAAALAYRVARSAVHGDVPRARVV
jgi:hypothetical protein